MKRKSSSDAPAAPAPRARTKVRALGQKGRRRSEAVLDPTIRIQMADDADAADRPIITVTFGSVTVVGRSPSEAVIEQNIRAGQEALRRGLSAFLKPGVVLPRKRGVPLFRASDDDPTILIRELNGKEERVKLIDGDFVVFG